MEYEILLDLIKEVIPAGEYNINGNKVTIIKDQDTASIEITSISEDLTKRIEEFKSCISDLNSDVFVKAIEEIGEVIDTNKFNELLDKEELTIDEADAADQCISVASKIIVDAINREIEDMGNLKDRIEDLI